MTLPCRIHEFRDRLNPLPLTFLFAIFFLALQPRDTEGQETTGSSFEEAGVSWLPAIPIQITAGVDTGYDDNVTLNGRGSSFARENVVLTYDRPGQRTQFYLQGIGRFSQYFDVMGQDDQSGNVTLGLTHNFSSRLSFYASIYAAYQTEPNFRSNVGPENVRAAHFDTTDIFSLTYHWLLRFTTITSCTLERVHYTSSSVGTFQNRLQSTFGEQ